MRVVGVIVSVIAALGASCAVDATSVVGERSDPCLQPEDCPDDGNPCTVPLCFERVCFYDPGPDGPAVDSIGGDCQSARCEAGELVLERDDTDDDDNQPCTVDTCTDAGPLHVPADEGDPCVIGVANGTCNASGQCLVECSLTKPCPTSVCFASECVDDFCEFEFFAVPTEPLDLPADCTIPICEDQQVVLAPQPTDPPGDDGFECTDEACDGTTPAHPPKLLGEPCGTPGMFCDGAGACVECVVPADCTPTAPCDAPVCDLGVCGAGAVPEGDPCAIGVGVCTLAGACVDCIDAGDCLTPTPLCSATNTCVECLAPGDCPDPAGECRLPACSAGGACGGMNAANGTVCATGVCCMGNCVASCP